MFLIIFAISNGLVLILVNNGIPSILSRWGAGSLGVGTVDFDAKKVLNMLLFS